jgi:hypothetical protein
MTDARRRGKSNIYDHRPLSLNERGSKRLIWFWEGEVPVGAVIAMPGRGDRERTISPSQRVTPPLMRNRVARGGVVLQELQA